MNKRTNLTVNSMKNLMNKSLLVLFLFMALPLASCGGNDDNDGPGGVVDPDEDPGTEQVDFNKKAVGYWKETEPNVYSVEGIHYDSYLHLKEDGTAVYFDALHGEYDESQIGNWNWDIADGKLRLILPRGTGENGGRKFYAFPVEGIDKGEIVYKGSDATIKFVKLTGAPK